MKARGFTEATQAAYVRGVLGLCRHCGGRKPGAITLAEAHAYVAHLKTSGASVTLRSHVATALHLLYENVLGQVWRPVSPLRRRMIEDPSAAGDRKGAAMMSRRTHTPNRSTNRHRHPDHVQPPLCPVPENRTANRRKTDLQPFSRQRPRLCTAGTTARKSRQAAQHTPLRGLQNA